MDSLLHGLVGDTFSNGQHVLTSALGVGFAAFFELVDDLSARFRLDDIDTGDLSISHADNSVSEIFKSLVVSDHDHSDFLFLVEVVQDFHYNVGTAGVQISSRLIQQ